MSYNKALESVATLIMGTSPKGDTYNNEGCGLPLLNGPTEFGEIHPRVTLFTTESKRECKPGDLIFCVRGSTTGRMNWADQVYSLGRGVCAIRGETDLDTRYIRYCLECHLPALLQRAGGATMPNLTRDSIASFQIPYLPSRHKIAATLAAYDDLIENNTRRIAILEEMAQAIYREWFVHFRFPGHEQEVMVESEIGMVPEGWEVVPVSTAVEINPRIKVDRTTEKPYVPMGNLSERSLLVSPAEMRTGSGGTKFQNGDTLFARITPSLENGKTGFVQFLPDALAVALGSTEFVVMRSRTLSPEFVYFLARSEELRRPAIKSMTGASGRQRVQNEVFDQVFIAHPPTDLIDRFRSAVEPMFDMVWALARKNQNLRQTRNLLLPMLVSGEVELAE